MKVFQIGAAGGIGARLGSILAARGEPSTGMHRRPDQAAGLTSAGMLPVRGDLIDDSAEQLARLIRGHDAVVFSAGAHGTGATTRHSSTVAGSRRPPPPPRWRLRRFVLVSVFPEAGRSGDPREGFEHYMRVKKSADAHLVSTDLDWVIVRPGTLRDEPGDDRVSAGLALEYGEVRRDNVAAFISAVLDDPGVNRVIVELTDGSTPVAEAVAALRSATGPRT